MKKDQFKTGDKVNYIGYHDKHEPGVVTSVSGRYVFVDYSRNGAGHGIATRPDDLVHIHTTPADAQR